MHVNQYVLRRNAHFYPMRKPINNAYRPVTDTGRYARECVDYAFFTMGSHT